MHGFRKKIFVQIKLKINVKSLKMAGIIFYQDCQTVLTHSQRRFKNEF